MKDLFTLTFIALLVACFTAANAQTNATIPYYCDFETAAERNNWTIPTSSTTNKWFMGTATPASSGSYSAYITSNTSGTVAGYNNVNNTLALYRQFNTVSSEVYRVSFDVKIGGETDLLGYLVDYLNVYWVDNTSINVTAWNTTTQYPPTEGNTYRKKLFNKVPVWTQFSFYVIGNGSPSKLVFLWANNGIILSNNNPGACIDNVRVEKADFSNSIWVNRETPYMNYKPDELVKKVFIKGGNDCSVKNVTFKGLGWNSTTQQWTTTTGNEGDRSLAYFSHGTVGGLGMTEGLLLTTGNAWEAEGPDLSDEAMPDGLSGTDADLGALVGGTSNTKTISILEFDFIPSTTSISFDYIFASEEYPEYSCSDFNDVFGFFISGPGISGKKNIAIIPGTSDPVSILNIHPLYSCAAKNLSYYVPAKGNKYTEFDGHTKMLTTLAQTVQPGQTYHLKLAIANVADAYVGSGVFLRAGSLDLGFDAVNNGNMIDGMDNVFEGCGNNQFVIKFDDVLTAPVYLSLTYTGTAVGDIVKPDGTPLPTTVTIPAGVSEYAIDYKVNSPVSANGGTINISVAPTYCPEGTGLNYTIRVYSKIKNPVFNINTPCGATSGTVGVTLTEGTPYVKLSVDTENIWYPLSGFTATLPIGEHKIHFKDSIACSIETFTIVIPPKPLAYGIDTQTECGSYTWIDGITYYENNNTATYTLPGAAANGCDSIVTLNLIIKENSYSVFTHTAIGSYTWIDGVTYTESNNTATYTIPGQAANGCDSIITLSLTVLYTTFGIDTQIACDSYTWIDGNTYYDNNNTATYTLVNANSAGCDSIVTLDLTINHTMYGIDTRTECDGYVWINGVKYHESNNTDTYKITGGAANGCDSIVTLDLTIIDDNVSILISEPICADDGEFYLTLTPNTGAVMPINYKIDFVEKTLPNGFSNFASQEGMINSGKITVQMPEKTDPNQCPVYPDIYSCTVILSSNDGCEGKSYKINYAVLYPKTIMEQKWGDVIALLNYNYNGHYNFAGYQWYHSGQEMIGETQSYIYIRNGNLDEGQDYYVLITREDGSKVLSCPYTAKAPKECCFDYPTVVNGGDVMQISLPNKTATVRLMTVTGIVLSSKKVNSGDEIVAPTQQGVYILEILSENNSREVSKIIVK